MEMEATPRSASLSGVGRRFNVSKTNPASLVGFCLRSVCHLLPSKAVYQYGPLHSKKSLTGMPESSKSVQVGNLHLTERQANNVLLSCTTLGPPVKRLE